MSAKEDENVDQSQEDQEKPKEPLHLGVSVDSPSACERHVTVTVAPEDIKRYYDEAYTDMMDEAVVPGFLAGRAPRKLVESRYRKEVTEQIKGSLLMDSMAQVNEEQDFAAISEPEIDLEAVEVPDEGPMTFEFDIEVRPEFDLPQWKGLAIEQPSAEFTDADIDAQMNRVLASSGRRVPSAEPAGKGDYLTVNISVGHDGEEVHRINEQSVCIRSTLSFRDGKIEGFDKLMTGAKAEESRETKMRISEGADNEELAGKDVDVTFDVLDVKRFELPELTPDLLEELGVESEGDLRDAIRNSLDRQVEFERRRLARQQITKSLTEAAEWELPPDLLKRQSERELERSVLELRRSGFSEADIQAHANELRQDSRGTTAQALREHFILERIAEEEEIDADESDYDDEISLIATQTGDSPRRVRAQIEKQGLLDSLRNQIIERKVIELVQEHAKFKSTEFKPESGDVEAIEAAAAGGEKSEIPVAAHGEAEELAAPKDHK